MDARIAVVGLLLALAPGCGSDGADGAGSPPDSGAANRKLARLVELAESGTPYLVLDRAAGRLRLLRSGALLREFPVVRVEIGLPSKLFVTTGDEPDLHERIYRATRLDPPRTIERMEVIAPPPGTTKDDGQDQEEAVYIPPPPEEAIPAPPRFFLRLDHGLSVEVRAADVAGRFGSDKLADLVEALFDRGPRLRITLDPVQAGALYRSVPEDVAFTIL